MKRKLCLFLALLTMVSCLTVGCGSGNEKHADRDEERYEEEDEHSSREEDGLTVSGGSPDTKETTESAKPEETTGPVRTEPTLVDVEVLTQIVYYDDDGSWEKYDYTLDEMGRMVREVAVDSEGNVIADNTTHWEEDGRFYLEGFVSKRVYSDGVEVRLDLEMKRDRNGGRYSVWVTRTDGVITGVEARADAPREDIGFSWYLPVEQYEAGDWGTSGWKYAHDEEGNLLCSISWDMAGILMESEHKYKPNGDLLYKIQKENGEVTNSEEITYDKMGRPVREVYGDTQVCEWTYNDTANTGELTTYLSDYFGSYEGLRKAYSEDYAYDSGGKPMIVYGQEYDRDSQTVTGNYNVNFEYDEDGDCRKKRSIDLDSGEVTVRSYDAHGNEILVENYDAAGNLVKSVRTDYIYTTIQVTPEVAEKYHSGK